AAHALKPPQLPLDLVRVEVPRGGGVFFHGLTLHGSRRNLTDRPRRACSIHWAGDQCRIDRSKVTEHNYPYCFSGLTNGGPIVNKYMPQVFPTLSLGIARIA